MGANKRTYLEVTRSVTQEEKERDILNNIFEMWGKHYVYIAEENAKIKSNESKDI